MKSVISALCTLCLCQGLWGQADMQTFLELPEFSLERVDVEAQLRFLSSDALGGRRTGSPGNDIAAQFLSDHFRAYGLSTPPGQDHYFQQITFVSNTPPTTAELTLDKATYSQGGDLLVIVGEAAKFDSPMAYAGFGWVDEAKGHNDYKGLDVKGKIVLVDAGIPDGKDPLTIFKSMAKKRKMAAERGALALFELYQLNVPWQFFTSYFGKPNLRLASESDDDVDKPTIPYGWVKTLPDGLLEQLKDKKKRKKLKASLVSSASVKNEVYSNNVCGIIEGRDEELKKEYILLSAHYDHVGMGKEGGGAFTPADSIFNGTRDNAMGTVALLSAAKSLAKRRPLRSVIVLAVTGEEIGLLGSAYYAEYPLIPLEQTVFNFNTDGAGYNDTTSVSVVGFGRTGVDEQIKAGASPFGLKVLDDPAPEQNLYDRSDNASFAKKGVPAVNFSPGIAAFDETLLKYYHQVADEAESVDFDYFLKYCKAYVHTARILADRQERPQWTAGDKYEQAGKKLYDGKE
ncbi:MAG: M28 family peptidase [Bacteroidota bacterium]